MPRRIVTNHPPGSGPRYEQLCHGSDDESDDTCDDQTHHGADGGGGRVFHRRALLGSNIRRRASRRQAGRETPRGRASTRSNTPSRLTIHPGSGTATGSGIGESEMAMSSVQKVCVWRAPSWKYGPKKIWSKSSDARAGLEREPGAADALYTVDGQGELPIGRARIVHADRRVDDVPYAAREHGRELRILVARVDARRVLRLHEGDAVAAHAAHRAAALLHVDRRRARWSAAGTRWRSPRRRSRAGRDR